MAANPLEANRKVAGDIRQRIVARGGVRNRIRAEGATLTYARDTDHLYVVIGEAGESLAIPAEDELDSLILYDPDTYEVRGFEFPLFMRKFSGLEPGAQGYRVFAELITAGLDNVYIPPRESSEEAEAALEDLALARP